MKRKRRKSQNAQKPTENEGFWRVRGGWRGPSWAEDGLKMGQVGSRWAEEANWTSSWTTLESSSAILNDMEAILSDLKAILGDLKAILGHLRAQDGKNVSSDFLKT